MTDGDLQADPGYAQYQAEFFHRFVAAVGPGSMHLLVAPIGAGKSFVMAGCISELTRTHRLKRVLILAPASLVRKWASLLEDLGREPAVIDGRSLRLLREQTGDAPDKWPTGIYAMSIDLAKRADVQQMMAAVSWDLVAVHEAHALAGQRLRLVESQASRRPAPALLLAANVRNKVTETFTKRAVVFDWSEAAAELRAEAPLVRSIRGYRRTEEEVAVAEQVLSAARQLGQMKAMVLLHRAASSISSLEDSLVRWVEDPERTNDHGVEDLEHANDQHGVLERLLQQVEQVHVDTRLACFRSLVGELVEAGVRHVVVFCEYRTTQEYLAAAVERIDFPDYQIHGAMDAARRSYALEAFKTDGGLLITTPASEGVSLNFIDAVIHYDLPLSPSAFAQREGRYRRFGRSKPCTVFFLNDETCASTLEGLLLRMVRKVNLVSDELGTDMEGLFRDAMAGASGGEESDYSQ